MNVLKLKTLALLAVLLVAGCGSATPSPAPPAGTATRIALEPTPAPPSPTATPLTDPTATPPSPTPSPVPSAQTPEPTAIEATTVATTPSPAPLAPVALVTGQGGGAIAFVSARDGNDEIYLINADGSAQRNLTRHPASDTDPTWSPDGLRIAFASDRGGDYDLYVMDLAGAETGWGSLLHLTRSPGVDALPAWSPDGTQVAFVSLRDGDPEVYLVNADGTGLRQVTHNDYPDWEFGFSPDGRHLVVAAEPGEYANVFLLGLDGSIEQQLTDTQAHDLYPRWSPDGSRIAFLSQRDGGPEEIYLMDTDGANPRRLTRNEAFDGAPSWSPDGTRLVFASDRDGDHEIYVMAVGAGTGTGAAEADPAVQQLTDHSASDRKPAWRPSADPVALILAQLEGLPIDRFLQQAYQVWQLRDPDALLTLGQADLYGVVPGPIFTDLSAGYLAQTQELERQILAMLRAYDRAALKPEQQIAYDALEWVMAVQVRGQAFANYRFLINPVWGLQNWPLDLLAELPLESKQDAETTIARLSSLPVWAEQVIAGLVRNEQAGAVPPRYVLQATIDQLDGILKAGSGSPPQADHLEVYAEFSRRIARLEDASEDEKQALLDRARLAVEEGFVPGYQAIRDELARLAVTAVEDPDQWRLPGGEETYAYLLQYYTGTDLSAGEIHAMGLAEVDRIQAEMRQAAVDMGYPADMSITELNQLLADHQQIVTGLPLGREYQSLLVAADQAARAFFDLRAGAGVEIRSVSDGPPAYYQPPEPGSAGPGVMPVNLDVSPRYVNYNEHVLVHHETIPGHHTQIALAQQLDVPWLQRFDSVNPYLQAYQLQAYSEGWALYAEILAHEMGLYEGDPMDNLGRLRLRLLRTVRMVADTGLYAKGWTLHEAAAYLQEATGTAQSDAAMMRYLVNPGYPCGYNVGGLKILELRQRAMDALGDGFDIQQFHNTVLGHGRLPIGVLERVVEDWIEQALAQ